MKNKLILLTLLIATFFVACDKDNDEYEAPNSFSDVGFYTSLLRQGDKKINIDDFISFTDLSHGATEHTWTITEENFFLGGPIDRLDSVYTDKIINRGETTSDEPTVHVLFTKGGLTSVNLYNTFKDSVTFSGFYEDNDGNPDNNIRTLASIRVGDKWVIDTTFVVDVYDTIVSKILIKQQGVVVPHATELDTIYVEAGDVLDFVDVTTIGRPNTREFRIAGEVGQDSVSTIIFKKLGVFEGSAAISRTGENIPGDYDYYEIPAPFKVIPSSKPFVLTGDIAELEDEVIQVPFNGEFQPFINQEQYFNVMVNGNNFPVKIATLNSSDATIIELTLNEPIYRPDVITVSLLDGSTLESTDTRKPVLFTDMPVGMDQGINIMDADEASFEGEMGNGWIYLPPWGNKGIVEFTTDMASHGLKSAKCDLATGSPIFFEGKNASFEVEAGKNYDVMYDVYIENGSSVAEWTIYMFPSWGADKFWNGGNIAQGVWVSKTGTFESKATENRIISPRLIGSNGVVYFDNFVVREQEVRP
ncbi:hypothetical protein [Polaribacter sp. SA4-12]|uniref:hypothetical protein n=1 Tax=Polaribacter sp. SA4-12 TaxID=1312072 RepID=UPI000B3CF7F7|nr:hypothetical protein [Polaribacter sp. SA4-12]ARV16605.1 hypothetical protein BTO07_16330 [Polaribacter sp. SA4-12]